EVARTDAPPMARRAPAAPDVPSRGYARALAAKSSMEYGWLVVPSPEGLVERAAIPPATGSVTVAWEAPAEDPRTDTLVREVPAFPRAVGAAETEVEPPTARVAAAPLEFRVAARALPTLASRSAPGSAAEAVVSDALAPAPEVSAS